MAEQLVLVCDDCGEIASETVKMTTPSHGMLLRDACDEHLEVLMIGRKAKRGRPPANGNGDKRKR